MRCKGNRDSAFGQFKKAITTWLTGELAQLGERLLCKQEVTGSIPVFSTKYAWIGNGERFRSQ